MLFSICIQFLVERAESYWLLFDLLHISLPLVTCNSAFCFFKLIAKSIQAGVLLRLNLILGLNSETRRKVSKVVPEVIHDGSRHHLTCAWLLIVENRGGLILHLGFILVLRAICSRFKFFVLKVPEMRLQMV